MQFNRLHFSVWSTDHADVNTKSKVSLVACPACTYLYQCDGSVRDIRVEPVTTQWTKGCESPAHVGDTGKIDVPKPVGNFKATAVDEVLRWGADEWRKALTTANRDIVFSLGQMFLEELERRGDFRSLACYKRFIEVRP